MAEQVINTPEALSQYEQGWTDMMVDIWQEQMRQLGCIATGHLYGSLAGHLVQGDITTITHQFPQYGIYVNDGTGREFNDLIGGREAESGYLLIKDSGYREEHGLNKPRKRGPAWGGGYTSGNPREPRKWFDKKYWYSRIRLNEVLQEYYGERGTYLMVQALEATFGENLSK